MQAIYKTVCLLACIASASVANAAANATKDWTQRPEIRAVRAIYLEVQVAVEKKQLRKTSATSSCFGENNYLTEIDWFTNAEGKVRKLHVAYGTSDSMGALDYYYDVKGKHRFTYYKLGAVNGTQEEIRVYFGDAGKQLHRDLKLIAGPGYPSGSDEYVPDPLKHVAKLCEVVN
jgi:hypothetical protein